MSDVRFRIYFLFNTASVPIIKISDFNFSNQTNPKLKFEIRNPNVARPGFEPRQTVPKTVVLPLYYQAISLQFVNHSEMRCKYRTKF